MPPEGWDFHEDGRHGERPSRPRIRTEPEYQRMRVSRVWTDEPQPRAMHLIVRRVNGELTLATDPPAGRIMER